MKKILILSALAVLSISSCSKDKETKPEGGNAVTYTIQCELCTATFDTMNGATRTFDVKGFLQHAEINNLTTINISTTGTGEIKSTIKVNNKTVHESVATQKGNTVTFSVKVD